MEEQQERKQDLETLNVSLVFLLLIIFSILLSLWAALLQREGLQAELEGRDASRLPPVKPIRLAAGTIIVGCLGYFLCLALNVREEAQVQNDPSVRRSAQVNTAASLLVLLAALLRLMDLLSTREGSQALVSEEAALPD